MSFSAENKTKKFQFAFSVVPRHCIEPNSFYGERLCEHICFLLVNKNELIVPLCSQLLPINKFLEKIVSVPLKHYKGSLKIRLFQEIVRNPILLIFLSTFDTEW